MSELNVVSEGLGFSLCAAPLHVPVPDLREPTQMSGSDMRCSWSRASVVGSEGNVVFELAKYMGMAGLNM